MTKNILVTKYHKGMTQKNVSLLAWRKAHELHVVFMRNISNKRLCLIGHHFIYINFLERAKCLAMKLRVSSFEFYCLNIDRLRKM